MNERAKEREYDKIQNEGYSDGGFNPYRQKREKQEFDEAQAQARIEALTPQGQIDALYRRIELECGSIAREWGNSDALDALQKKLYAQIDQIKAGLDETFLAFWPLENTKERRETWNNRVKSGEFGNPGGGRVDFVALNKAFKKQGWSLDDLKRAIKLHCL
jgi:hypothetical protein